MELINYQISIGIDNLLSGALTHQLALVQRYYTKHQRSDTTNNINYLTWNRSFIRFLLDYCNDLWLFRCKILRDDEKLTHEALV